MYALPRQRGIHDYYLFWCHSSLISEALTNKHYQMTAMRRVPEEMNIITDTLWGITVVAYTVNLARGFDIESG